MFRAEINALFSHDGPAPHFISESTGILIIAFNCYDPSQDKFMITSLAIDFSLSGILIPASAKIISFSLDQLEQTSKYAMLIDGIQLFFCFCYLSRVTILKCKLHIAIPNLFNTYCKSQKDEQEDDFDDFAEDDNNSKKKKDLEKDKKDKDEDDDEPIDGYSPTCSIITDSLIIFFFGIKFIFSQRTNYHDLNGILNDNYLGDKAEKYIELVHFADYYMEQY